MPRGSLRQVSQSIVCAIHGGQRHAFFREFLFPLLISFHQCSTLIFILILLSEGQTGEAWKPSNKKMFFSMSGRDWTANEIDSVLLV